MGYRFKYNFFLNFSLVKVNLILFSQTLYAFLVLYTMCLFIVDTAEPIENHFYTVYIESIRLCSLCLQWLIQHASVSRLLAYSISWSSYYHCPHHHQQHTFTGGKSGKSSSSAGGVRMNMPGGGMMPPGGGGAGHRRSSTPLANTGAPAPPPVHKHQHGFPSGGNNKFNTNPRHQPSAWNQHGTIAGTRWLWLTFVGTVNGKFWHLDMAMINGTFYKFWLTFSLHVWIEYIYVN